MYFRCVSRHEAAASCLDTSLNQLQVPPRQASCAASKWHSSAPHLEPVWPNFDEARNPFPSPFRPIETRHQTLGFRIVCPTSGPRIQSTRFAIQMMIAAAYDREISVTRPRFRWLVYTRFGKFHPRPPAICFICRRMNRRGCLYTDIGPAFMVFATFGSLCYEILCYRRCQNCIGFFSRSLAIVSSVRRKEVLCFGYWFKFYFWASLEPFF